MLGSKNSFAALCELLLATGEDDTDRKALAQKFLSLSPVDLADVAALANQHHVVLRAFQRLYDLMIGHGSDSLASIVAHVIENERRRIDRALRCLEDICNRFEDEGCNVIVIKSLDHWPDLGSDLDLYTDVEPAMVIAIMKRCFDAVPTSRSWGDRLAYKWNFTLPGLPEMVEFHIGRLGQTGEQTKAAITMSSRAERIQIDGHSFQAPSAEDRLIISTLQRMYRHFYLRLCDIVDTVQLLESRNIDYEALRSSAEAGGIWRGTATYLEIVSDYVKFYRGTGIAMPPFVMEAARFGGDHVSFAGGFLRIPIMPQAFELFAYELGKMVMRGDWRASLRLTLFPGLATAALLGFKVAGTDKGIW